jgi:uncharacterized protein
MSIHLGTNENVDLDLERLIVSKMLITAQSGGGKSWLIRRLLEQTHGKVQQIIIDPEGEFYTLREKYDYVLARPKGEGDCPAEPKSAGLLAESLLQLGISAILDIYELTPKDRVLFVKNFLVSLVNAPKKLWHKVLIVVDEADIFAPEEGENESTNSVRDLMTRGRKRGFCGILACNRLSQLDKTAAAPAKNVLIGQNTLDVDVKRACKALGLGLADGTKALRVLEDGQFYAFGPALSRDVVKTKIGPVNTTHPIAGAAAPPPAPPRAAIQKVLAKLAELPAEAIQRELTEKELRDEIRSRDGRIRELERASKTAPAAPPVDTSAIVKQVTEQVTGQVTAKAHEFYAKRSALVVSSLQKAIEQLSSNGFVAPSVAVRVAPQKTESRRIASPPAQIDTVRAGPGEDLPPGEKATLIAVAQYPEGASRTQLSVLTAYRRSSRDAYLQRLRTRGYVEMGSGGLIVATDAGIAALGSDFEPLPEGEALRDYWFAKLPEGERKVLEILVAAYPGSVKRDSIDEATGYQRSSRDAYLQRLTSKKLVDTAGRGEVRAVEHLF